MYDRITDHYAAAREIGLNQDYAARLAITDLKICLKIASDEVLKAIQVHTGTRWGWGELNDEFNAVYFKAIHELKGTAANAFIVARAFIPSEIERREYDRKRLEEAAEMLEYMERARKERTERKKDKKPIQVTDVIKFYRYFKKFFPDEEPGKVADGERRKKWALRHDYSEGTIRNAEAELREQEPKADEKFWYHIEKIGPEKVEYIANQLTEQKHENARYEILNLVELYRENPQKRGP